MRRRERCPQRWASQGRWPSQGIEVVQKAINHTIENGTTKGLWIIGGWWRSGQDLGDQSTGSTQDILTGAEWSAAE
jgi:hypothetical protein